MLLGIILFLSVCIFAIFFWAFVFSFRYHYSYKMFDRNTFQKVCLDIQTIPFGHTTCKFTVCRWIRFSDENYIFKGFLLKKKNSIVMVQSFSKEVSFKITNFFFLCDLFFHFFLSNNFYYWHILINFFLWEGKWRIMRQRRNQL